MITATSALAALMLQALAQGGATHPLGARLEEGRTCYALQRRSGETMIPLGRTLQIVRRETVQGRAAVRVIVHQQAQGGAFDVRDEFVLQAADLRPIRYVSRRGDKIMVDVTYRSDTVTGYRLTKDGVRQPLSAPLDGPVWDGNLWGLVFAALPLAADSQISLPFWHYAKGFGHFALKVVGTETVTGPSGPLAAWLVEATDGTGPAVTYRIAKDRGLELSYTARGFAQVPGGSCEGLPEG